MKTFDEGFNVLFQLTNEEVLRGHHFQLRDWPCLGQTSTIIPQPTPESPTAATRVKPIRNVQRNLHFITSALTSGKTLCVTFAGLLRVIGFTFCTGLFRYKHTDAGFDFENRILSITWGITLTKIELYYDTGNNHLSIWKDTRKSFCHLAIKWNILRDIYIHKYLSFRVSTVHVCSVKSASICIKYCHNYDKNVKLWQ